MIEKLTELIYQADVADSSGKTKQYFGLTENTSKKRYYGHMSNIKHKNEAVTALSNDIQGVREVE